MSCKYIAMCYCLSLFYVLQKSDSYKIGIMYCKSGQSTEEEMYNNEHSSTAFIEFLDLIGKRVRLKGFEKYKGGLDNKSKCIWCLLPNSLMQTASP